MPPIYGGCSVTDQIAGQIYYPTRNAPGVEHPVADPRLPAQLPIPPDPARVLAANAPDPEPGPGVLIGSYCWGTDAARLGALSNEDRIEVVLRCVREIHGTEAETQFDGGASMAWSEYPWTGGAFLQPGVRELQIHRDAAMQPEGSLYFSGDHLSPDPGWIQGSIRSTREQLRAILNRAGQA